MPSYNPAKYMSGNQHGFGSLKERKTKQKDTKNLKPFLNW